MKVDLAIEEIINRICEQLDAGEVDTEGMEEQMQGFASIKSKAEGIQRLRESDDETYRAFIWQLLNNLFNENGDYLASDGSLVYIQPADRALIVEQIFGMYRGLGVLDPLLMDEEITELMVNGPDHIFVEKRGRVMQLDTRICNDTDCDEEERYKRGEQQLRKIAAILSGNARNQCRFHSFVISNFFSIANGGIISQYLL